MFLIVGPSGKGSFLPGVDLGSFRKGMRVAIGVPGGLVWGQVQGDGGGGSPVEKMREREGGGEGGQAKEPASQCARICQNYPLAIYPLSEPIFGKGMRRSAFQ